MTQKARARAIERFSDTSSSAPTVFLLSLTAGGVGLNLTAATRVFLMDPVSYNNNNNINNNNNNNKHLYSAESTNSSWRFTISTIYLKIYKLIRKKLHNN